MFLGSNSFGCGADDRTYSLEFLETLIAHFVDRFTIVVIGQARVRNAGEQAHYRRLLARFPDVIDLVDRTSLEELAAVMDRFAVLVSTDSSPVHIALARDVPVVGLYVRDATFRMSPITEQQRFVAPNSRAPCFYYSWRWRFFCSTCRDASTRARYCHEPVLAFGVDRIPIAEIDRAVQRLLDRRKPATGPSGVTLVAT